MKKEPAMSPQRFLSISLHVAAECPCCRYIVEWLRYHLLYGVQHFYLLSNECDEAAHVRTMNLLAPVRARARSWAVDSCDWSLCEGRTTKRMHRWSGAVG